MVVHTPIRAIELFAGVGMLGEGLRAGLQYLGLPYRTMCYVEREAHAASILAARGQEGSLDHAPIWSDVLTFDGEPWRGRVDAIVAGFPCQDLSLAGKRAGLDGERSGLFFRLLDIADACGARWLFLENVSGITSATASVVDEAEGELEERAVARVLGELARRGWNAEFMPLSASDVGASHGRARWFCFAWRSLDDAGCVQRGQGHEQNRPAGPETSGNEANNGAAHRSQLLDDTQRIECPGQRIHQGPRPAWPGATDAGRAGGAALADAHGRANERRGRPVEVDGARGEPEGEGRERQRGGDAADHCGQSVADTQLRGWGEQQSGCARGGWSEPPRSSGAGMADTGKPGLPQPEPVERRGARPADSGRAAAEFCGAPLFAPGPGYPGWADILAARPELAPALEPDFRELVDGLAFGMDDSRAERLKCCGNGVVALCAAAAAVVLLRRAAGMMA